MKTTNKKSVLTTGLAAISLAPTAILAAAGKTQIGVDHLTLDEVPVANVKICEANDSNSIGGILPDQLVIVPQPFKNATIQLSFTVGELLAHTFPSDHVIALGVSRLETLSPAIFTPNSSIDFGLDLSDLEIIGLHEIRQSRQQNQAETRFGRGDSVGRIKFSFNVNLETDKINQLIRSNRNELFLQAILLPKDEFEAGNFSNSILSEVDRLLFIENDCPTDSPSEITITDQEGKTAFIEEDSITKSENIPVGPSGK